MLEKIAAWITIVLAPFSIVLGIATIAGYPLFSASIGNLSPTTAVGVAVLESTLIMALMFSAYYFFVRILHRRADSKTSSVFSVFGFFVGGAMTFAWQVIIVEPVLDPHSLDNEKIAIRYLPVALWFALCIMVMEEYDE